MDVTLKNLIVFLLLLFVVSEAAAYRDQEFSGVIPVFQEGEESSSLIDWGNIAPRLRSYIKVSVLFPRWKIPGKLMPDSGCGIRSFSSLGWIQEAFFSLPASKQDLYHRNNVYRI
jgi:hypothetical protein